MFSILDAWRGSEYACVQISSNNILCYHNKRLMGYFEFLYGSGIICLPLNIPEKLHWQHIFEKPEEAETHRLYLSWYDAIRMRPACNIYHSNKWVPPPSFLLDTNPVTGHVLVHSFDKTHNLVVIVELIWFFLLNILSFNFVPMPNKFLLGWKDSEEVM